MSLPSIPDSDCNCVGIWWRVSNCQDLVHESTRSTFLTGYVTLGGLGEHLLLPIEKWCDICLANIMGLLRDQMMAYWWPLCTRAPSGACWTEGGPQRSRSTGWGIEGRGDSKTDGLIPVTSSQNWSYYFKHVVI